MAAAARARTRVETDSLGPVEIPEFALWGTQTQRSLRFFAIGDRCMPLDLIHAMAWIKWAAAGVNHDLNLLDETRAKAIALAAQRVALGEFDDQFPISVWQTGSGTQSHMNVNEVIATVANRLLVTQGQGDVSVSAHDDVNRGQSSNDVFPSALHIAVALQARERLWPALHDLSQALATKAEEFAEVIKVGRTHMQDATPVTLGQEFGGYVAQLVLCERSLVQALDAVHSLALGGTAVGTGLNAPPQFGARVSAALSKCLKLPLTQASNLFAAMAGHEALVAFHGGLRMMAIALTKIGNDIRLMGSGPAAGLGELQLPPNEPGSSIMPGKVNPTQIEALTMVCTQVMGHDVAVGLAASQGHFELNVYKPLIALNVLDSIRILADAMHGFSAHCVRGLRAHVEHNQQQVQQSLMLGTALAPHIGYAQAAKLIQHAQSHGTPLREAAMALGLVSGEQFDQWVDARQMLGPAEPR